MSVVITVPDTLRVIAETRRELISSIYVQMLDEDAGKSRWMKDSINLRLALCKAPFQKKTFHQVHRSLYYSCRDNLVSTTYLIWPALTSGLHVRRDGLNFPSIWDHCLGITLTRAGSPSHDTLTNHQHPMVYPSQRYQTSEAPAIETATQSLGSNSSSQLTCSPLSRSIHAPGIWKNRWADEHLDNFLARQPDNRFITLRYADIDGCMYDGWSITWNVLSCKTIEWWVNESHL